MLQYYKDNDGNALEQGKVYVYRKGTLTQKKIFSDADFTNEISQPLRTSSIGEAVFYTAGEVRIIVNTSTDEGVLDYIEYLGDAIPEYSSNLVDTSYFLDHKICRLNNKLYKFVGSNPNVSPDTEGNTEFDEIDIVGQRDIPVWSSENASTFNVSNPLCQSGGKVYFLAGDSTNNPQSDGNTNWLDVEASFRAALTGNAPELEVPEEIDDFNISIGTQTQNYNLFNAMGSPTKAVNVVLSISAHIYSANPNVAAFDTGNLPDGSTVRVTYEDGAQITGARGGVNGKNGGGTALTIRRGISYIETSDSAATTIQSGGGRGGDAWLYNSVNSPNSKASPGGLGAGADATGVVQAAASGNTAIYGEFTLTSGAGGGLGSKGSDGERKDLNNNLFSTPTSYTSGAGAGYAVDVHPNASYSKSTNTTLVGSLFNRVDPVAFDPPNIEIGDIGGLF